jgi:hypothetical protein
VNDVSGSAGITSGSISNVLSTVILDGLTGVATDEESGVTLDDGGTSTIFGVCGTGSTDSSGKVVSGPGTSGTGSSTGTLNTSSGTSGTLGGGGGGDV